MAGNSLQLKVILSALDKATAPLKRIQGGSLGAAKALKEARDKLKELNTQQKDISAWRTQRAAAEQTEQTEQSLGAARDKVKQLSREFAATGSPTRQMTRDLKSAIREATALKRQHSEQQTQLQGLRTKLNAAGISTRNLGQGERDLHAKIAATNDAISEQGRRMQRLTSQQKRLAMAKSQYAKTQGMAGSMAGTGAGAVAAGAAIGAPVLGAVKTYMAFEDAMLGVAKQVEGARDENGKLTATYYEMGDSIKAMAERIPMATTDIAALVEGGARMGIQGKDNLLKFAEEAANAATAFELPADQIGENLARIASLYKLPIKNVGQLGDAINYLDDNAQSKGADIIDVMQRTAGITASVGMSFKDAAALGSTFLTLGASAEVASSATNAMIRELAIATQQPKRFQKGLKALGLEADAIQSGMAKNATGTLQQVLDTINKLPKDQQLSVTTQLFGKEFGDDAAKLAANIGEYRRQLDLASSEKGSGSMQREADIRAEAMSARLEMAQNRLFNLGSSLGETLRPTLVGLLEGFNNIVASISAWVKENPALAGQIIKTAAGLAGLAAAFGTITLGLAAILGPFAMVRLAMTVFGVATTASLWPLLAVIAAVAALGAAAYLVYKNWEPIKAFFGGLWAEVTAGFSGGLGGIAATIINFSPLGLFYRAFAAVMNYFGVEMPSRFTGFGSMLIQGMVDGITNGLGSLKTAITGAGESAIGWFKEKLGIHSPSRVFATLGGFTMAGLANGLAGGEGDVLKQIAGTAKRLASSGADMLSGKSIEFDKRPPISAASGGMVIQGDTNHFEIHATPGTDVAGLQRMINQMLDERERNKATRIRSRLGDLE